MSEFMKTFMAGLRKALYVPPTYADTPSDASLAEGWRIAYEQQKELRILAERRLALLRGMSDDMIKYGWGMQYGHDIRTVLDMTKEELYEDYA